MADPPSRTDPPRAVLGDEVYATLSEAILDGTLPPGERLRDHELAERLGVSRTPVREALLRLARSGLVEMSPNRYTRVSTLDDKLVSDTDEFVAYTIGNCLRIGAERSDDATLEESVRLLELIVDASRSDDSVALREATTVFFQHTVEAAGNVAFLTMLREAEIAIRRNLSDWQPFIACPISRTQTYEQLRDAVAARDGARAETLMRQLHGFT